jgi:hypothetical protein
MCEHSANRYCVVPDLSYHSMGFLAQTKRRSNHAEPSCLEPLEYREIRGLGRKGGSLFTAESSPNRGRVRSEGPVDMEIAGASRLSGLDIDVPPTTRPRTTPAGVETTSGISRRRQIEDSTRPALGLGPSLKSVSERASRYGAGYSCNEAEGYPSTAPGSMRCLLRQTGVFDGMSRANTFTPEQRYRPTEQDTIYECPRCKCAGARSTSQSSGIQPMDIQKTGTEANPFPRTALQNIPADVDTQNAGLAMVPRAVGGCADSPAHNKSHYSAGVQKRGATLTTDKTTSRTKIALMAQIPVYIHKECQTDSLWPQSHLQQSRSVYAEAGTQTASSTIVPPRQVPGSETVASRQRERSVTPELLEPEASCTGGDLPVSAHDDPAGQYHVGLDDNPFVMRKQDTLNLVRENQQERLAMLERMAWDLQHPVHAGPGLMGHSPSARGLDYTNSHNVAELDYVRTAKSVTVGEERPVHTSGFEGRSRGRQGIRRRELKHDSDADGRYGSGFYQHPTRFRTQATTCTPACVHETPGVHNHPPKLDWYETEPNLCSQELHCQFDQGHSYQASFPEDTGPALNDVSQYPYRFARDENHENGAMLSQGPSCYRQNGMRNFAPNQDEAQWQSNFGELRGNYGY